MSPAPRLLGGVGVAGVNRADNLQGRDLMRKYDGLFPLTLALLMTGCPGDDGSPMDTDTDTDTDTEGTTTGATSAPTIPTNPIPSTGPTDPSTSMADSTTGSDDTTDTGEGSTTDEPPPTGTCVGVDQIGDLGTVFSLDGALIDATCEPTPMPCGGDPVGTWNVLSSCGYDSLPNPLEEDCPGSTFEIQVLDQSGTLTLNDDGTFVRDFDVQLQAVFGIDTMSCFMLACDDFEGVLQMDDPTVSCVDQMGTCTCTFPPEEPSSAINGTYEVMGDTIMFDDGGDPQQTQFCVTGDRLDTWDPLLNGTETMVMCEDAMDCADALGNTHEAYVCVPPA